MFIPLSADKILERKRLELEARVAGGGELGSATVFEHFLSSNTLTMEEIYANMADLLLTGVDTVCCI